MRFLPHDQIFEGLCRLSHAAAIRYELEQYQEEVLSNVFLALAA